MYNNIRIVSIPIGIESMKAKLITKKYEISKKINKIDNPKINALTNFFWIIWLIINEKQEYSTIV